MSHFHEFERSPVIPQAIVEDDRTNIENLRDMLGKIGQEVRMIHNSIQSFTVAVAGGAGSKAVTLPAPHPDTDYAMSVMASWGTTHAISLVATTGFTDTFGTAAPGGGGTLYVSIIG